jgi:hypothetical protein
MFWNSEWHSPFGTLTGVCKQKPEGILREDEGARLIYGETTHFLIGSRVEDLRFLNEDSGLMRVEWTRLPGAVIDAGRLERVSVGSSVRRQFMWKQSVSIGG